MVKQTVIRRIGIRFIHIGQGSSSIAPSGMFIFMWYILSFGFLILISAQADDQGLEH